MHAARTFHARLGVREMATRESVEKELHRIEQCMAFWSLKRVAAAILIPVVCAWVALSILETRWFEGMLPAQLQTTGLATVGRDQSLLDIILTPVRYKSCGGATFTLTGRTLDAIRADRLAFFEQAHESRRGTGHRMPFAYTPWRETPVPPEWTTSGMWIGLVCMGWTWSRLNIYNAAQAPGS
jgi:hypothetical protein